MTDVLWVTPTYPWAQEPAFGIFYQTQAQAVAGLGVALTVACPIPWAPWPLSRVSARWGRYAAAPGRDLDGSVPVVRPRYVNVPGEPTWARPDQRIAGTVWRARREWTGARGDKHQSLELRAESVHFLEKAAVAGNPGDLASTEDPTSEKE